MGYRRTIATGVDRRDRLAVVVIAVTVAVVVAGIILTMGMGAHAEAVAGEMGPDIVATMVDEPDSAEASADGIVILVVEAQVDGEPAVLAGIPPSDELPGFEAVDPPSETASDVRGPDAEGLVALQVGENAGPLLERSAEPRTDPATDPLPPSWYLTTPETATALADAGASSSALVIEPATESAADGTPAPGLFSFVSQGMGSVLQLLGIASLAAAVLVAVVTYSVAGMMIEERRRTLGVIQATGAAPRTVASVVLVRVGVLVGLGIALGYSIGTILANGLVRIANIAGWITAVPTAVTREVAVVLVIALGVIGVAGLVAGALALRSLVREPPAAHIRRSQRRSSRWPGFSDRNGRLFGGETLVVTGAAVTVFVVFAVLTAGIAGAMGPLVLTEGATMTEAGAPHPVASSLDASIADRAEDAGVRASPEILGFGVVDREPVLVRGVEYESFSAVTEAEMIDGSAPAGPDEVVIGAAVAERLDRGPGDTILLGGSTRTELAPVTVSGVYDAPGADGDQILTSLETARQLAGVDAGAVNVIRFADGVDTETAPATVTATAVPQTGVAGEPISVTIRVDNPGPEAIEERVPVRIGDETVETAVSVPPYGSVERTVELPAQPAGTVTVHIANEAFTVTVRESDALVLPWFPETAPPNATMTLPVETVAGETHADIAVAVDGEATTTDEDGMATIQFPDDLGETTVAVGTGDARLEESITIDEAAPRPVRSTLHVAPDSPDIADEVTVTAVVTNPWSQTVERTVVVDVADAQTVRTVTLAPGEVTSVELGIGHQPPGEYTATIRIDGTVSDRTTYRVTGDDTLAGVGAGAGELEAHSGMGQAIDWLVGDLRVVVGTVLAIAGMATVAGTVAVFSRGVFLRRGTLGIRRATGADPLRVVGLVLRDALWVAVPAVSVAVIVGTGLVVVLARLGRLSAFGVTLSPGGIGATLGWVWLAGIAVAISGAILATVLVVRGAPGRLLAGREQ